MYDIVTLEPNDQVVQIAQQTVIQGQNDIINGPGGNYRLITPAGVVQFGNGGAGVNTLVVIGHGGVNTLSTHPTWNAYVAALPGGNGVAAGPWTTIWLVSCGVGAQGGNAFAFGNFANGVRAAFPNARVWASAVAVNAHNLLGEWAFN